MINLATIFLTIFVGCQGAKILGVFNHPGASHTIFGKALLKALAGRGHEVVMMSSFPLEEPIKNYKDVDLPELLADLRRREMMYFGDDGSTLNVLSMALNHTEQFFNLPQVLEIINSKEKFDVILMDYFYNEPTLILGHHFKAPVVLLSSFGNNAMINSFTGNYLPVSYVPGATLFTSDDMTFKDRFAMSLLNLALTFLFPLREFRYEEMLNRHFENPPRLGELRDNIAIVLANSHFSFETPRPYTPNIIPVGGCHIEALKELPRELREFLDAAVEGVVVFSLGTQIKSSNLDRNKLRDIVEVFEELKLKVVWKYEGEISPPRNVKIVRWLPQAEVLAHPNVKLFINHGGMLSVIETIHFGVPILCMPFNGDQFTNAAFIISRGIGLKLELKDLTKSSFGQAIRQLTTDPKYAKNAKYRSSLLRVQPVRPIDNAVFWVEHVIEHKGAPHLKPFSMKLPLYKYYLIDVIAVYLAVVFAVFYGGKKVFCLLLRLVNRWRPKLKRS